MKTHFEYSFNRMRMRVRMRTEKNKHTNSSRIWGAMFLDESVVVFVVYYGGVSEWGSGVKKDK